MKTILLAVSHQSHPRLVRVLARRFKVVSCFTLQEASHALETTPGIDLVLCGMHFDESRMFNLIDYIRQNPATTSLPILCIKVIHVITPPGVYEAVKSAAKLKNADFFNYRAVLDAEGEEAADRQLLDCLSAAIDPPVD